MRELDKLRTWNAEQSWHAVQHFDRTGPNGRQVVRFFMRRNAYDHQSSVRVDMLDQSSGAWNPLVSHWIADLPAARLNYISKGLTYADDSAIERTRDQLLSEAGAILG